MSISQKYLSVFANWDKEVFRSIHHEVFMSFHLLLAALRINVILRNK